MFRSETLALTIEQPDIQITTKKSHKITTRTSERKTIKIGRREKSQCPVDTATMLKTVGLVKQLQPRESLTDSKVDSVV